MAERLEQLQKHLRPAPGWRRNFHDLNPTAFLPRAAEIMPDGLAIVHRSASEKDIQYTYRQFAERASDLAYYVKSHAFANVKRRSNTIAVLASNTPMVLEAYYGIVAAGGIVAAINYRLKAEEVAYIVRQSRADIVLVDREYVHLLDHVKQEVRVVVDDDDDGLTGDYARCLFEGRRYDESNGSRGWTGHTFEHVDENSVMALMYTSGTTGHPKAVEYTHRGVYLGALGNVVDSSLNCIDAFGRGGCKYLATLPYFHAIGWTMPYACVSVFATAYLLRKMDYGLIWRYLKLGITNLCCAPTVATFILEHPDCVKLEKPVRVTVAAAPPSPALFSAMIAKNLAPVHVYGLTETYGPLMKGYLRPEWLELEDRERFRLMARQGYGFTTSRAARVRVQAEDGVTWLDVRKDGSHAGEIHVQGNIVMQGYFDNSEATEKAFTADGYFRTGDIAVMHDDGAVEIRDRAKDEINTGGEKVSSIEIEAVLLRMPALVECAVVGKKHAVWGETPVAFVTTRAHTTAEEVRKFVKDHLAGYKVPSQVIFVSELPKTSTGKVQKNVLREQLNQTNGN
ncbi:hypothetical protein PYCC9005_002883 [Savitreella phatthalungensis]